MATIGQALESARAEADYSVQRLNEVTRINEAVIRAIERDDFAVCGGDFYARGHLRTICRVLGIDAAPLLTRFDAEHAEAPAQPKSIKEVFADYPPDTDTDTDTETGYEWWRWAVFVILTVAVTVALALFWLRTNGLVKLG